MRLVWLVIIAIIIIVILYEMIHRLLLKRATLIIQRRAQTITDQAIHEVFQEYQGIELPKTSSKLVAEVWGHGVLSFEYDLSITNNKINELSREELQSKLDQYAKLHHIDHIEQASRGFLITDWWQGKTKFHIDVTYLMNEASLEYVHDLKKLQKDK